ncbi:hypothetical protein ACLK1S_09210 [Escherichia coli]
MVGYVPPLSPIQSYADAAVCRKAKARARHRKPAHPAENLANMSSAGDTGPVPRALKRMMAMRQLYAFTNRGRRY